MRKRLHTQPHLDDGLHATGGVHQFLHAAAGEDEQAVVGAQARVADNGHGAVFGHLIGAGGCSAIDVVSILQKGRHDVTDCEVKLTSERREEAPRLFTHINLHFVVTGKALKDAAVSRAVDLSAEKYCSVALMLGKGVNITHSYEVIEAS